jgi:hypothetical protein|tara:strand:+ start:205 stop:1128 length:924 start_codon:yes stop_codon:yes gene_type:complete
VIFWRVVDNKLYSVGEVNRLGFEESEGLRVPDEYLDKQQFMIMRGAQGLGDWGIISAMPRLIKEKYPDSMVYVPSQLFLENLFGNQSNGSTWSNPYENVHNVFSNNPFVDGVKDYMIGEVFHDHYRVYNKDKKDIPLVKQMLKFWQFEESEYDDCLPELYFSEEEKRLGDKIIKEKFGENDFGGLLITNRFESRGGRYDEKTNKKLINLLLEKCGDLPFVYWTYKKPEDLPITFQRGLDMRHIPTRIQLYIRTKAKLNIGTHCGFLDCISRYSKVFQIQRVFPLNQNVVENEFYVNNENYEEVLEYV